MITAIRILLLAGMFATSGVAATERDLVAVEVFVHQEKVADVFRYTYVIDNHSAVDVVSLEVGLDYHSGMAQLSGLDPAGMDSPPMWSATVVTTAESDLFSVAWSPSSTRHAVKPRRIESGFVLESPTQRDDFLRSNWTVIFDGGIVAASSRLEQIEGPALEALRAR